MTETIKISPYFPRGDGLLVSIILPTRGRIQGLLTAVDSLYNLANNKSNLEFIFKADDDDKETIDTIDKISSLIPNCKSIVSPRGRGYLDFHLWVNEMCSISTGDWLFLMNDDAKMLTQDWDDILERAIGVENPWPGITELCTLTFCQDNMSPDATGGFYLLRRKTYELLGHFSLSPMCDNWLWRVMNCCGCYLHSSVICVNHYGMDDQLRKENSGVYDIINPDSFSYEQVRLRTEDVVKITNRMGYFESRREWKETPPEQEGWFLWKAHCDSVPTNLYIVKYKDNMLVYGGEGLKTVRLLNDMNGLWAIRE